MDPLPTPHFPSDAAAFRAYSLRKLTRTRGRNVPAAVLRRVVETKPLGGWTVAALEAAASDKVLADLVASANMKIEGGRESELFVPYMRFAVANQVAGPRTCQALADAASSPTTPSRYALTNTLGRLLEVTGPVISQRLWKEMLVLTKGSARDLMHALTRPARVRGDFTALMPYLTTYLSGLTGNARHSLHRYDAEVAIEGLPYHLIEALPRRLLPAQVLATHPDLPVEKAWELSRRGPTVRAALAGNDSIPVALLEHLARDRNWRVRHRVVGNIHTPAHILWRLSSDRNENVASAIPYATHVTPEIMDRLSRRRSVMIRGAVADSARTPSKTLTRLAKDDALLVRVAGNENTHPRVLARLTKHERPVVRRAALFNHATPIGALHGSCLWSLLEHPPGDSRPWEEARMWSTKRQFRRYVGHRSPSSLVDSRLLIAESLIESLAGPLTFSELFDVVLALEM